MLLFGGAVFVMLAGIIRAVVILEVRYSYALFGSREMLIVLKWDSLALMVQFLAVNGHAAKRSSPSLSPISLSFTLTSESWRQRSVWTSCLVDR